MNSLRFLLAIDREDSILLDVQICNLAYLSFQKPSI